MTRPSDEQLSAFLDGELSGAEAAQVERAIESDPEVKRRFAALRQLHARTKSLYVEVLDEAPPAALIAAIRAAPLPRAPSPRWSWRNLFGTGGSGLGALRPSPGLAFAATALVVAAGIGGGIAGWQITKGGASGVGSGSAIAAGPVESASLLAQALDETASGQVRENDGVKIELITTVLGEAGQVCREFRSIRDGRGGETSVGVACLGSGERWVVELVALEDTAPADVDVFVPARAAVDQAIEYYFAETIRGETLSLDDEASLMKGGWRTTHRDSD